MKKYQILRVENFCCCASFWTIQFCWLKNGFRHSAHLEIITPEFELFSRPLLHWLYRGSFYLKHKKGEINFTFKIDFFCGQIFEIQKFSYLKRWPPNSLSEITKILFEISASAAEKCSCSKFYFSGFFQSLHNFVNILFTVS